MQASRSNGITTRSERSLKIPGRGYCKGYCKVKDISYIVLKRTIQVVMKVTVIKGYHKA